MSIRYIPNSRAAAIAPFHSSLASDLILTSLGLILHHLIHLIDLILARACKGLGKGLMPTSSGV